MKKIIRSVFVLGLLAAAAAAVSADNGISVTSFSRWSESLAVYSFTGEEDEVIRKESINESLSSALYGIPVKQFKPWTSQTRIAGFAETEEFLLIPLNAGVPLLFKPAGLPDGKGTFTVPGAGVTAVYTRLTEGLTIGTVYSEEAAEGGSVFIHFYRDTLFNPLAHPNSSRQKITGKPVLIRVDTGGDGGLDIEVPDFGFAADNPGWEPVEFLRKKDGNLVAWKYTDEKKTRFRYIRHDEQGRPADEIDEAYFRDEYCLYPVENGPFSLRGFVRAVREGAAGEELGAAGDLYLRVTAAEPGGEYPLFYSSPARTSGVLGGGTGGQRQSGLPVELPACSDGDYWYILSEGEVFFCGANVRRLQLPALPEDFEYRDLWVSGRDMIVSWEESRFPFTGRSGMMYIRMRDILNGG